LSLTIATSAGSKKKGGGELTIYDFLPEYAKPKRKSDPEARENRLKAFLKAAAERSKEKELNG
jgi:hypothetical protein